jgi:arabinose-5-phosphate isomerase
VTVTSDSMTEDAIALMNANRITSLFVVSPTDVQVPVGIVHVHDFLRPGQL